MAKTIFYSWQSDRPEDVTRGFIREALDEAVKIVTQDIGVEDAIRVTSDTQDEPGHPPIFDTILNKIDEAVVFVPDVSIVGEIEGEKPSSRKEEKARRRKWSFNQNVAIEYGYALKALGSRRIIPVMNTAFGGLRKLPFDMAHRRGPIRYELRADATPEQRAEKKEELVRGLVHALTVLRNKRLLDDDDGSSEEVGGFEPVAPLDGSQAGNFPVSLLGRENIPTEAGQVEKMIWLRNGPQTFLRLVPTQKINQIKHLDIKDSIVTGQLLEMRLRQAAGAVWHVRNREGAAAVSVDLNSMERDSVYAIAATQVFTNREIWGVDTELLEPERSAARTESGQPHIGAIALEWQFILTLLNYMKFARDYLGIQPPVRWVAGLNEISEHRLRLDHEFSERPLDNEIIETGLIRDYNENADDILMPFFHRVWEQFGRRRPPSQSDELPKWTRLKLDQ